MKLDCLVNAWIEVSKFSGGIWVERAGKFCRANIKFFFLHSNINVCCSQKKPIVPTEIDPWIQPTECENGPPRGSSPPKPHLDRPSRVITRIPIPQTHAEPLGLSPSIRLRRRPPARPRTSSCRPASRPPSGPLVRSPGRTRSLALHGLLSGRMASPRNLSSTKKQAVLHPRTLAATVAAFCRTPCPAPVSTRSVPARYRSEILSHPPSISIKNRIFVG